MASIPLSSGRSAWSLTRACRSSCTSPSSSISTAFPSSSRNPTFPSTSTPSRRLSATKSPPPSTPQLTLALIKPSVCAYQPDVSSILKLIKSSPSLSIARTRRLFWTSTDAHAFYSEHRGRFYYDRLILGMISGPSLALALYGPNAIAEWRSLLGPTKAYMGKYTAPHSLRSKYGLGDTRNGFHGSDSPESAKRELALVFDGWDTEWWMQREQGRLPVDGQGKVNPLGF